ncbi:MAG: methyltransferase domain-containing protein [Lachnospiraceae bacterium]|nr:methyltransferase domain-containing protein [Lachnospiraceae bacterium]
MNTTKNFDGYAKDYTVGRPDYAAQLIDSIFNKYGLSKNSVIADIGSGTGKFSRQVLDMGSIVFSVEPNDDMRSVAETELSGYPNFHSIHGDAENTTLESGLIDFVTTAQAFHWFDVQKFRNECIRILKENGKVALIWNIRDRSDVLNQELYQIYTRYCPRFKGFSGGIVKDDPRIKDFFGGDYDYLSFDNPLFFDKDRFVARSLSGSYSLKEGDTEYKEYMDVIIDTFNRYSSDGIVKMGNSSVAYIGSII